MQQNYIAVKTIQMTYGNPTSLILRGKNFCMIPFISCSKQTKLIDGNDQDTGFSWRGKGVINDGGRKGVFKDAGPARSWCKWWLNGMVPFVKIKLYTFSYTWI